MNKQIGTVNKKTIKILGLNYESEKPIFIGDANIKHMKTKHPNDFKKYSKHIVDIINNPTYLARNEKKQSIEFIKEFKTNNEYVLVVVRVSNNNIHFVRTMYVMDKEKVTKYFNNNYFYKL